MKLEDLAIISDACRHQGFPSDLGVNFVRAIKPYVIEYWETGVFKEKEHAIAIATKLTIAVASVCKYAEDEPELWGCLVEMLNWSLNEQVDDSKLIPMSTYEFVLLVTCLSRRHEKDA